FVTQGNMPDAKLKGAYISDDTFANYIISEYAQAKKPVFMFNISMQNHWPYTTENYYQDNNFVIKTNKSLDQASMTALQNYTQGIHDADKSLKKMIDYFKTVKEPTVVIFLGDHLPALTEQLGVYKKLEFIDDESISDKDLFHGSEGTEILNQNMFIQNQKIIKTPYLIWSNYKTGMEKGKTLSANYLGVYVMSKIGLELPPFYHFLLDYSNKVPVNRHFLSVVEQGIPYKYTPSIYDNYEYTYKRVQNDMLFGYQNEKDLFSTK
ncbi:MAG: sulfatase-like hydrolase/transferase, partial [Oscillospiraceae bacterium]